METDRITYNLDELMKKQDINDKEQQKQALIDMMRGDEELGLYDE